MVGPRFIIWLIFLETAICVPTDEGIPSILNEGEGMVEKNLKSIVPGKQSPSNGSLKQLTDEMRKGAAAFDTFIERVDNKLTLKGLTFTIYDDAMRDLTILLMDVIGYLDANEYDITDINKRHVNEDLLNYAGHIYTLYNKATDLTVFTPPFIEKPNFFVNGEVIFKALKLNRKSYYDFLSQNNRTGNYDDEVVDEIVINANYSGWNLPDNGGEKKFNYFREDIALNSYYYGLHLLHPYWIGNQVLDSLYARHSEYYYFTHQQLVARYLLEKEYSQEGKVNQKNEPEISNFNPYLVHENGLPFPIRTNIKGQPNDKLASMKKIDIAIKECISRGIVYMDNATISITEDNYVPLLSKLIRANYDGMNTAKITRSYFGYGSNVHRYDEYNPAPSVMHFPETSLRDPLYWQMMNYALNYFDEVIETMEAWDISPYELEDVDIVEAFMPKITTYFEYYQFNINKVLNKRNSAFAFSPLIVSARQKRLKHSKFELNLAVNSNARKDVVIRIFIGPPCDSYSCWQVYKKFFELDKYIYRLKAGANFISWSPEKSYRFSDDEFYNLLKTNDSGSSQSNKFNLFKFPENLIIPKGLEKGINLTLFVMITPADSRPPRRPSVMYVELHDDVDDKPLGFPFHRPVTGFNVVASSYKFFTIPVFHKRKYAETENDYYSSDLT